MQKRKVHTCAAEHTRTEVVEEFRRVGLRGFADSEVRGGHSDEIDWLNPLTALFDWIEKLFHIQQAHCKPADQTSKRIAQERKLGHLPALIAFGAVGVGVGMTVE